MGDDYKELVDRLAVVWGTPLGKEAAEAIERLSADLLTAMEMVEKYKDMAALKSARAEPVAWMTKQGGWVRITDDPKNPDGYDIPLYHAPAAVQEGWQLVPKEPTKEMNLAGMCERLTIDTWKAMLAAAPKPPVQEGE